MAVFRSYDLLKLVQDHGQELTLRKTTVSGTYDPATGTISGATTEDYTVDGYFFNFSTGLPIGDEIRRGSRRCVIPALGLSVEPDDEDQIIGQGDTVSIVRVNTIYSGGTAVCYVCEVSE
jgi:hypothetical protein